MSKTGFLMNRPLPQTFRELKLFGLKFLAKEE
jgi:hypothetical protein